MRIFRFGTERMEKRGEDIVFLSSGHSRNCEVKNRLLRYADDFSIAQLITKRLLIIQIEKFPRDADDILLSFYLLNYIKP